MFPSVINTKDGDMSPGDCRCYYKCNLFYSYILCDYVCCVLSGGVLCSPLHTSADTCLVSWSIAQPPWTGWIALCGSHDMRMCVSVCVMYLSSSLYLSSKLVSRLIEVGVWH